METTTATANTKVGVSVANTEVAPNIAVCPSVEDDQTQRTVNEDKNEEYEDGNDEEDYEEQEDDDDGDDDDDDALGDGGLLPTQYPPFPFMQYDPNASLLALALERKVGERESCARCRPSLVR